jgi:hypothetical protein
MLAARASHVNTQVRANLKSMRIALLYAERLSLRDKRDASCLRCWLGVEIPKPGPTLNVENAVGDDGVDTPAAVSRRLGIMPALQLVTMVIYFGNGAGGSPK